MSYIQPYLQSFVEALIGLLAVFLMAGISAAKKKAETWLESRTTAEQRETLYGLAQEGMSLAEATYKAEGGPAKLQAAMAYVAKHAATIGLTVPPESIQAAIEKAVLEYNKNKAAIPAAPTEPDAAVSASPEQEEPTAGDTANPGAAAQADEAPPADVPAQTAATTPESEPAAPVTAEDASLHAKLDMVISLLKGGASNGTGV